MKVWTDERLDWARFTCLVNSKQPGTCADINKAFLIMCFGDQKHVLKYSLHPSVPIGYIHLPLFLRRNLYKDSTSEADLDVHVEFLNKTVDSDYPHYKEIHVKAVCTSPWQELHIPSTLIASKGDHLLVKAGSEYIECVIVDVVSDDVNDTGLVNSETKVRLVKEPSDFFSAFIENPDYRKFIMRVQEHPVNVLLGLHYKFYSLFIDHLKCLEDNQSVQVIDEYPIKSEDLSCELLVLLHTDGFLGNEAELLSVLKNCLISKCTSILFIRETPLPLEITNFLDKESLTLHSFDFKMIDEKVKQSILNRKVCLNGFGMRELYELHESTNFDADLKRLQRTVWSKAGHVIDPSSVSWSCIRGYEKYVKQLREAVYDYFDYKERFVQAGLGCTKGILISGPSGSGKTLLARTLAADNRLPVITLPSVLLYSNYFGETEARLRNFFEQARSLSPCIVLLDDVELLAPIRSESMDSSDVMSGVGRRLLTTLLNELDGFDNQTKEIIIIACTSRKDLVDPAFMRPGRMDVCIELELEDPKPVIDHYCKVYNVECADNELPKEILSNPGSIQLYLKSKLLFK